VKHAVTVAEIHWNARKKKDPYLRKYKGVTHGKCMKKYEGEFAVDDRR